MSVDVHVGYMTVSLLEQFLREYIKVHIVDHKYIGGTDYLLKYEEVKKYLGEK